MKSTISSVRRRFIIEWFVVLMVLCALGLLLKSTSAIRWLDNQIYDRLWSAQTLFLKPTDADARIVIVAIDESSLKSQGQWPWPRATHAQLLNQIAKANPAGIALDLIFTEPSNPDDDKALSDALAGLSNVTLPVLLQPDMITGQAMAYRPIESFAAHAKLGHISPSIDVDGVLRELPLMIIDEQGQSWQTLTSLILPKSLTAREPQQLRIPFALTDAAFITVTYDQVLKGQIQPELLQGKYVLIGPTAVGLGDRYTTPITGQLGAVAGIEVHANVLKALLDGDAVTQPTYILAVLSVLLPIGLLMCLLYVVHERFHLLAFVGLLCTHAILITGLLWYKHLWLPPMAIWLPLSLAYLIWSWRRLVVLLKHVAAQLNVLQNSTGQLSFLLNTPNRKAALGNILEHDLSHIRQLYQFTGDALNHNTEAQIAIDNDGRIVLANHKAQMLFGHSPIRQSLHDLLAGLSKEASQWPEWSNANQPANWGWLANKECHAANQNVYQLHTTAISFSSGASQIWLISLIDLTTERKNAEQRSELVKFLSHDMRAPQVDILALLELRNAVPPRLSESELHQQIEERVQRTLDWASDMVNLTQVQSRSLQLSENNLYYLALEAIEQISAQASAKGIQIHIADWSETIEQNGWVYVDGALIERVIINLIGNAIRYSPAGSSIDISFGQRTINEQIYATCCIQDEGGGISKQQFAKLAQQGYIIESEQLSSAAAILPIITKPDAAGSLGVGLSMVSAIVRQHGGYIYMSNRHPVGLKVDICVPKMNT